MPFEAGQSGNPLGYKTKRQWIAEQERFQEAKRSWAKLLKIRDDLVLERKTIKDQNGDAVEVEVVASIKDLINCCREILNRAIGLPKQDITLTTDKDGQELTLLDSAMLDPKTIALVEELAERVMAAKSVDVTPAQSPSQSPSEPVHTENLPVQQSKSPQSS